LGAVCDIGKSMKVELSAFCAKTIRPANSSVTVCRHAGFKSRLPDRAGLKILLDFDDIPQHQPLPRRGKSEQFAAATAPI
jgi:hypothetical protein